MSSNNNYTKISSPANSNAIIRVIPGHFATTHSHVNFYVDMTILKSRKIEAQAAAAVLAMRYSSTTVIDTIICMDGCDVIGAYLADELTKVGILSVNQHKSMYVVSPEEDASGQLIFRDNMTMMIKDRNCLLLLANATTGKTVARSLECIRYYGGKVQGVSAIFSASPSVAGMPIYSIFTTDDIPDYETYEASSCPLCARGKRIDAIVNSYGYSRL